MLLIYGNTPALPFESGGTSPQILDWCCMCLCLFIFIDDPDLSLSLSLSLSLIYPSYP